MNVQRLHKELQTLVLASVFLPWCAFGAPGSVHLPNAWQITDNSNIGGSTLNYTTNLTATQQMAATNVTGGFRYIITGRLADNFGSAAESMTMIYGTGNRRFLIWWGLDNNGDLTARLEGGNTYPLTNHGNGAGFYHTHEISYDPNSATASYVVDGNVITNGWPGSAVPFTAGQVYWGAGSSAGRGQMNFNRVTFATSSNTVTDYDAGLSASLSNPGAPDPTSVGWTLNAGDATTVTNLAPDEGLSLAVATTRLEFLSTSNVVVRGSVHSAGAPVLTWFEWGTDTNYGNVTAAQDLGLVTNTLPFNATLPGLLGGPDYHYRAVASNSFGVLKGEGNTFNLRFIRSPVLPEYFADSLLNDAYMFVSVADFDADGRLDVLLTGTRASPLTHLWRSNPDGTFSNLTSLLAPDLVPINGPSAWGDFDNDGRLDFLIAGRTNEINNSPTIQLWRNTGSGFTNVPLPGVPGLQTDFATLAWRDFDNDGRLDFMIKGFPGSVFQLWHNTGAGFAPVSIPGLFVFNPGTFQWGDYDNDGRADFLTIGQSPTPQFEPPELWRNTGGSFTNVPLPALPRFGLPFPTLGFADYDSDGWLDFLVSGSLRVGGALFSQLWRNTSEGFTNSVAPSELPGFIRGRMAWGDYNNDGRVDFMITGRTNLLQGIATTCQLWENLPGGFTYRSPLAHPDDALNNPRGLVGFYDASLAWADFNRDGRLDLLISGRTEEADPGFGPRLFLNNMAVSSNQPPTTPTNLSATVSGGHVALCWHAATDDTTPPPALTYNVRIGTTPGGRNVVSPPALADGQLTLPEMGTARNGSSTFYYLPPGTYYWSVQAVDNSFAGSPFAVEQQFTIGPQLINLVQHPDGVFEFSFTNHSALNFDVLVSTNVALPVSSWLNLGPALHLGGGYYRFTDAAAVGHAQRYYILNRQ